jgi:excisionase family DNA binding protein
MDLAVSGPLSNDKSSLTFHTVGEEGLVTSYNAIGTVDVVPTPRRAEMWIESLVGYSPSVAPGHDGRAEITITVEAPFFEVAATTGLQLLLTRVAGSLCVLEVMTTEEFDRRTDRIGLDLIDTQAAAEILGVSRQRIQQLCRVGALSGVMIGNALAIPRAQVEARAARRRAEGAMVDATNLDDIALR